VYAKLNQKFKLQIGQPVKITDYDMKIEFTNIQGECFPRKVYGTNYMTGNVVDAAATYPVKISVINTEEEEAREVRVDSGYISICEEGQLFAQLTVTRGRTKYVNIKLGEKKEVFGATLSFLDYYSRYRTGLFLVSKGVIDCPEECTCSADGSMECPAEECISGTILCPDGVCRTECVSVDVDKCSFGCLYGKSCLPIGTRVSGQFCDIGRDLEKQLGADASCENNFECKTNLCIDSQCVESGVLKKIIAWFRNFF